MHGGRGALVYVGGSVTSVTSGRKASLPRLAGMLPYACRNRHARVILKPA